MAGRIESGDAEKPISDINVTPFVDIILVVLIIFMVTTRFIMNPSINIQLPKAATGDESIPSSINVGITADGKIYLNGKITDDAGLSASAADLAQKRSDGQAVISADRDSTHGSVIHVIGLIKKAGIQKFAVSIEKE